MTTPCKQGERLATLETTSKQTVRILDELKKICGNTYDVLSMFSGQHEQIKSLTTNSDQMRVDLEEAFGRIRTIEDRHNIETGVDIADNRWKKSLIWFFEKLSIPVLMTFCFLLWVGDKFNWFTRSLAIWKEFKG